MTKARNTFERFQQAQQERREHLMVEYLEQLKTSRVKFQHVTGLAEMVATHISYQEQKPCNRATLLRNSRYKALLLTFMAAHLGGGTKSLKFKDVTDEKAKALVVTSQLEASNLRREVQRLKIYIAQLERQQSEQSATLPSPVDDVSAQQRVRDVQLKLTRLAGVRCSCFDPSRNATVESQPFNERSRKGCIDKHVVPQTRHVYHHFPFHVYRHHLVEVAQNRE